MTFDEYGTLWLTDPWIAIVAIVAIVGVVLWSHGWIVSGAPPRPRPVAVRLRRASMSGLRPSQRTVEVARPRLAGPIIRPAAPTPLHAIRLDGARHRSKSAA